MAVDLARPGTWDALTGHLRAASEEHGSGFYHVVHFDLHGLFTRQEELDGERRAGRVFLRRRLETFEGNQGFLFFETAEDGRAEAVPAREVAALLAEHRVPVAVLSACQSARQIGEEASLAQQLVQAGVPVAVGMAYSVTVSAAEAAMPVLYGRLARRVDPVAAVHAARRELFDHPARRAYFDQELDLDDWVLPVLFRQRPVQLRLREMTPAEEERFHARAAAVAEEPATEYGFVGRDLDIQAIERRLLTEAGRNELLVRGMAGAGKSTLLAHLGWWWQRTGLVEEVFAFSYEERAWTAAQIVREVGKRLLGPVEQARLDALSEDAQVEKVAGLLRAHRHLLVVDNAESVTASPASIPHALTEPEQRRLRTLLARLRGGRSLVLVGSREAEAWLAAGTFADNVYPLPGLDPQASSALVERILARHGATGHRDDPVQREALGRLVELLGGYPLPLTVVLPVLAATTPAAVLAELDTGGAGADPVGLVQKAIEYSHGKLDPATQHSLLLLAPFVATVPTGQGLDAYQRLLAGHPAVAALGGLDLAAALAQAVEVGLAAPHPQLGGLLAQVQPVLPYFLRSRLREHPELAGAAAEAHHQLYTTLGAELVRLLTGRTPQERALGQAYTRAAYANLTAALAHTLATAQPALPLLEPLEEYLDQTRQVPARRTLLDSTIAAYGDPAEPARRQELAWLHHLAGMVAQAQRRFEEADAHYRRALDIYLKFGDEHSAAGTYHNLGMAAQEQRRFEEADAHYRRALDIKLEVGNEHGAASTYHQLGIVAQEQRRFEEADAHYRRALDTRTTSGDERGASTTATHLGVLLARRGRHADAVETLLYAAVSWHRLAGTWSPEDLGWLKRERRHLAGDEYAALCRSQVPADVAGELDAAIDRADEPRDDA